MGFVLELLPFRCYMVFPGKAPLSCNINFNIIIYAYKTTQVTPTIGWRKIGPKTEIRLEQSADHVSSCSTDENLI